MRHFILILSWIIGWLLWLRKIRYLEAKKYQNKKFCISVIIPTLNEEHNIGKILNSLKTQNYKPYEIIVVNDNSKDKTASIASSFIDIDTISLKKEPPKGWIGKPWSCWNGYLKSTGDLLLFLDADVELSREALESLVTEYIKHGGLISVWPYQRFEKFYEHLIMPFNLIAISSINSFSLFQKSTPNGVFGPVILTSRSDYEKTGGHLAVKNQVVEDLKIGKIFLEKGIGVTNILGGKIIKFRMYPKGLKQLFEGLSKNMAFGAIQIGMINFLVLGLWFGGIYSSFFYCLSKSEYLIYYPLYALQIYMLISKTGDYSFWDVVFYPLHFLFFLMVFLSSIFKKFILRSVTWKGRKINV
jgi:glycosyltransferase involved in cell wall biosynthesis